MGRNSVSRMLDSLEGLSTGDAYGQLHFRAEYWSRNTPPSPPWFWTDDTEMACAVVNVLAEHGEINQDALADEFAKRFDRERGYGPAMVFDLLPRLKDGEHWSTAATSLFDGTGSFGNGAAMRVAPVGAYFADDRERVVEQARKSAVITHAHPDAVAGAIAVAVATATVVSGEDFAGPRQFLKHVADYVPDSTVRRAMETAIDELGSKADLQTVVRLIGNGSKISAADTVPFCLWIVGKYADSYEKAVTYAVSVGGDMDTNAAIVGGILAGKHGRAGIPQEWHTAREPLPRWLKSR